MYGMAVCDAQRNENKVTPSGFLCCYLDYPNY